jgi:sugar fermentation stimulation protein A
MLFSQSPVHGVLLRRYNRFLADVRLAEENVVTAHCTNTGSMLQVSEPDSPVMITPAKNPNRSTHWDWQMIKVNGLWAGINTSVPNILLREGFELGIIPEFRGYSSIKMEVRYGDNSRVDALLSGERGLFYVEAKNVTLAINERALFPDSITVRGLKHLDDLAAMVRKGHRAAVFFLVQRMDAESMGIAGHIDSVFATRLTHAVREGVEVIAWQAKVTLEGIFLGKALPFVAE